MNKQGAWAGAAKRPGKGEIGLVATLFCVATLVLGFGLLADEVKEGDTKGFDTWVAQVFRPVGAAGPIGPNWLHEMARDVTSLGSMVILCFVMAAVVGYLLLVHKRGSAALLVASLARGNGHQLRAEAAVPPPPSRDPGRHRGVHLQLPQQPCHAVRRDLPDARRPHDARRRGRTA